MIGLRLIQYDFDNMENRHPERETDLGLFVGEKGLTAHGKVSDFIKSLPPVEMRLGWDGEVYPQFKIEEVEIK